MLIFSILLLFLINSLKCELHPVLLVPGLGGSQIISKYIQADGFLCHTMNKSFLSWIDLKYFTPFTINCIINLLKLEYNVSSHTTSSPKYCENSVPGFGRLDTIAYISNMKNSYSAYFIEIIKNLVNKHNYTKNVNLRGAPYDFRKGPNELKIYLLNVKNLIEEMYDKGNGKPVVIICHSLGNLLILKLLNQMSQVWKDKYIRSFISISAPYSGSMMALQSVLSGFKSATFFVNALKLRKLESTWPSLYYLMPISGMWPNDPIVLTKSQNFTVNNISQMMRLSKEEFASEHYNDVLKETDGRTPPNVEVHCIISSGLPTTAVLDYRKVKFPNSAPISIKQDGDGTVSLHSLMICPQWKTKQTQTVTFNAISKVKHLKMVKHAFTVKTVSQIISKINEFYNGFNT